MSELVNDEENFDDLMGFLDSFNDDENIDYDKIVTLLGIDFDELQKEAINSSYLLDVNFSKSHPDAKDPEYAYPTDSGFDLYSTEEVQIDSLERKLIPTGLHIDIPEGYEIQVRSKSGLALKDGLMVLNSPGTVDQGYTGEIQVILFNTSKQLVKITKGQKIAQAVLTPVVSGKWVRMVSKNKLDNKDRNENGFGSTGV